MSPRTPTARGSWFAITAAAEHAQGDRAVVDVADLAQRGAVTGDKHRAAKQQPLEHALLAVGARRLLGPARPAP
jgi:hypothetical protein